MACCNSSWVQCDEKVRQSRDESSQFWSRPHAGGPGLTPQEQQMYLRYVHNQKIYRKIELLRKRIKSL